MKFGEEPDKAPVITAPQGTDEAPERPVREWKRSLLSVDGVFCAVAIVAGVLGIGLSPVVLTDTSAPQHVSGGIDFLACGAGLVLIGTFLVRAPARAVREYRDGRFEFVSRRRRLVVAPGGLRSVRCIGMDPSRLGPMRIKADNGWILISSRMSGAAELFRALQASSPTAYLTDPRPRWSRGVGED